MKLEDVRKGLKVETTSSTGFNPTISKKGVCTGEHVPVKTRRGNHPYTYHLIEVNFENRGVQLVHQTRLVKLIE